MRAISAVVGLAGAFGGKLCVGSVGGDGNVEIEERGGIFEGEVLFSMADIMFVIGWSG